MFLSEMQAIFRRLSELPGWEENWPSSTTTLRMMLRHIGFYLKCVERLAVERNNACRMAFCRLYRDIPDRCIVVVDEAHIVGQDIVRRRGRAPVGEPRETLAPDPRACSRYSSTGAISWTRGILNLVVNEMPQAQNGDEFALF